MAGKPQNIKVRVDALIAHIESTRDQMQLAYLTAMEEFTRLDAIWKGSMIESARNLIVRLEGDDWPDPPSTYRSDAITIGGSRDRPLLPKAPEDKIDSDLNLLRLAADETITINTESDWAKYL